MYEKELEMAIVAAKKAGELLKKREDMTVDSSKGHDVKLSADKLSEKAILECLKSSGIPILSEECGYISGNSEYCWIVDPLDGTMNYLKQLDEFVCVSIALWKNGEPVLGVINRFFLNQLYYGVVGEDAFLNDQKIVPSSVSKSGQAILATGFPVNMDYSEKGISNFIRWVQQFKKIRMFGSAALMAVFVGCGKIDAYFESSIMLWDIAAAAAIVTAAGGVIDIKKQDENKCIFKSFANQKLMEDCYDQGL